VEILKANQQYSHPEMDGPEVMLRVRDCQAAEFLVAELEGQVVGMIRGTYGRVTGCHLPGLCAPDHQRQGIGRALVIEIARRFKEREPSVLPVIIPGDLGFWHKMNFRQTTRVMQAYPIDKVLSFLTGGESPSAVKRSTI